MFRSLRWTLQLWHAGILLVALTVFGLGLYMAVGYAEMTRVDAEVEKAARLVTAGPFMGPRVLVREQRISPGWMAGAGPHLGVDSPAAPYVWNVSPLLPMSEPGRGRRQLEAGPQEPREFDDPLQTPGQQLYYIIWGPEGSVIRQSADAPPVPTPTFLPDRGPAGPAQVRHRGEYVEGIVNGPFGTHALAGRSIERELQALRHLRWTLLAIGGAIFLVGLGGGWLLSGRAIRPIKAISETARRISGSDLSRRIDVKDTHSELGSLAHTLNDTFDRLETAFQRQVRFTADASHELRTPLSVIHSHTELALNRPRTAEEYRQTLETCLRASKRMKSLVDSLLVLARADAGKLELKYEQFDLRNAAEDCAAMVAPLAQERNVRVTIDTNGQAIPLQADRTRISQLLTNLLGNAIRYNREGGSVTLSAGREGEHAILKVADTGVGIAPDEQRHVFERFFRADKARSREAGGSGLGLAICQSIVEAHHGQIHFTSQPGEGTTFTVELPMRASSATPALAEQTSAKS